MTGREKERAVTFAGALPPYRPGRQKLPLVCKAKLKWSRRIEAYIRDE